MVRSSPFLRRSALAAGVLSGVARGTAGDRCRTERVVASVSATVDPSASPRQCSPPCGPEARRWQDSIAEVKIKTDRIGLTCP